jgi:hypothetical protein
VGLLVYAERRSQDHLNRTDEGLIEAVQLPLTLPEAALPQSACLVFFAWCCLGHQSNPAPA